MITVPIMVPVPVAPSAIMVAVISPMHSRRMITIGRIAPEMAAIVAAILAGRIVAVIVPPVGIPVAFADRSIIVVVIEIIVIVIAIADARAAIITGAAAKPRHDAKGYR
jgi:hypothetical protein